MTYRPLCAVQLTVGRGRMTEAPHAPTKLRSEDALKSDGLRDLQAHKLTSKATMPILSPRYCAAN
jgi:hypothetical protein